MPPLLFALTIHEFAHAYAAYRQGDDTAYRHGRMTLNPLAHLDIIGTLMLMFSFFGWAKPVPINPHNFTDLRRGIIISTAAGPLANLLTSIASAIVLGLLPGRMGYFTLSPSGIIQLMLIFSVVFNVNLAIFNLIPIPPLDGSQILGSSLRGKAALTYAQFARSGPIILLILLTGSYFLKIPFLWWLVSPIIRLISRTFAGVDIIDLLF